MINLQDANLFEILECPNCKRISTLRKLEDELLDVTKWFGCRVVIENLLHVRCDDCGTAFFNSGREKKLEQLIFAAIVNRYPRIVGKHFVFMRRKLSTTAKELIISSGVPADKLSRLEKKEEEVLHVDYLDLSLDYEKSVQEAKKNLNNWTMFICTELT